MLASHDLDKLTVDDTVEGDDDGEKVSEAQNARSPNFRSVLWNIYLEETLSFSNCYKLQSEGDWPNATHDAEVSHILVAPLIFVGRANQFAVNENLIAIDAYDDNTREDDYF